MKKTEKLTKIVPVTNTELLNILTNFRKNITATGVAFGAIVYFVDESKSRVAGGKKMLQKFVRTNLTIGANYEKRINRDLEKQGEEQNFTAQAMSGKEYVNDEGVVAIDTKTRTKHYLVATVENKTVPDTVYFHQGKKISKDEAIKQNLFMPSAFTEKPTSGRDNMSIENDFHTISQNIDNILSLTLNRTKYKVQD